MLNKRWAVIILFLMMLPVLLIAKVDLSFAQNRGQEKEERLKRDKKHEVQKQINNQRERAGRSSNERRDTDRDRGRRGSEQKSEQRQTEKSTSRDAEKRNILEKIRERQKEQSEQRGREQRGRSNPKDQDKGKAAPDDKIRQVIEREKARRKDTREQLRERLGRRNKRDLEKMRNRREIMRRRILKRFDKKQRESQLEEVKRRLERRRERDNFRSRANIQELRRELNRARRHRIISRRGKIVDFEIRGYRFRKHRYKHLGSKKYRNGLHIYLFPPIGAIIALNAYVVDGADASLREIEDVFDSPMAVNDDETYDVNDIIEDPEIRRKVRSVNLDSITFSSGSSEISEEQLETLDKIAQAMVNVLERKPNELFLIEGHTDATGEEEFNQSLSEDRAAAVKDALITQYGIPEQNLIEVGYGEEFLKIDTQGDEEENRRVAIRNISPLMAQDIKDRKK